MSATPPPVNKLLTANGNGIGDQRAPRIGPGGRRMVKSFSQDAASSMASTATVAMNTLSSGKLYIWQKNPAFKHFILLDYPFDHTFY